MPDLLDAVARSTHRYAIRKRIWIGYSGGPDSHVLLHLAARAAWASCEVHAVHVHHGLHAEADAWAEHCARICAVLQVPFHLVHVEVAQGDGSSLEAAARDARYAAFREVLGADEALLLAHHAEDQAETLLLQLLRGAGPAGLAAMPAGVRLGAGWLLRPLLPHSRADLQAYAARHELHSILDHSNADLRFARNFLRLQIMPLLRERWPGVVHTLVRAAAHQAQAAALLEELGRIDLNQPLFSLPLWKRGEGNTCFSQGPPAAMLHWTSPCPPLPLARLRGLAAARRTNALRTWLQACAVRLPATAKLMEFLHQLDVAAADRQPRMAWPGGDVRCYREALYALPEMPASTPLGMLSWRVAEEQAFSWGRLRALRGFAPGVGFPPEAAVSIKFRQGGEVCRWQGHRRRLKQLLQEAHVLPWLRDFIPLVYIGGELAVIPGIGVCDGFLSHAGDGWKIEFQLTVQVS